MPTPDQLRQFARQAQAATRALEKAVTKGDISQVQQALDAGAVPEWGTYPNKKGTPMGSLVGRSLKHRNLALLQLLLDAGAPAGGDRGASVVKTAVRAEMPEALALLAPFFQPTDEDWRDALTAGLPYFKALDDAHHLDRARPMNLAPQGFTVIFHALDVETLDYLVATGADPLAQVSTGNSKWTPSEWFIQRTAGLEEERGDIIQGTLGASAKELGLELMGEGNPLALLMAMERHGDRWKSSHLGMACYKGYPDVLVYLLRSEPTLRIDGRMAGGHVNPTQWLDKRPRLREMLLVEQRALDLERATPGAHATAARPRI